MHIDQFVYTTTISFKTSSSLPLFSSNLNHHRLLLPLSPPLVSSRASLFFVFSFFVSVFSGSFDLYLRSRSRSAITPCVVPPLLWCFLTTFGVDMVTKMQGNHCGDMKFFGGKASDLKIFLFYVEKMKMYLNVLQHVCVFKETKRALKYLCFYHLRFFVIEGCASSQTIVQHRIFIFLFSM
ncbi:hypothetical protein PIB30_027495 [Stylosanthes scabra]|uniref:Uncharacterized protein n=1 Tax=Stylosanthes scabra TaxID=79078 RepID=A0ABU6RB02_9FABA|nr:hypothetical protein [Stylosanthes scabra]